jgi:DNA-binding NarL/FixJ family response regulator
MRRISTGLAVALAAVSLGAAPAAAATSKYKVHSRRVSCIEIKDAIASGKSTDQVAKDLKVSETRVKSCKIDAAKLAPKPAQK